MKKLIEKLKTHKKIAICSVGGIIALFLIVLIVIITGKQGNVKPSETEKNVRADNASKEVVIQYVFSDGDMSRGEWIKLYSEKFGMYNYVTEAPFFVDVSADNELFPYVQTCVENSVLLQDSETLNIDEKMSLHEAITWLGRTYGEDYISRRTGKGTLENDDYLEYMLSIDEIKQYQNALDKGFNRETAEAILDIVWESYMNREWENDSNIVYAKGVINLSDVTDYTYDGSTVNIKTNEKLEQGKIIVLGATEDWETGLALKINEISGSDDTYIIKAEIPEFDEVVETLYVEMNELVGFENFIPEEGVTVVGNTEAANYVSDLYNSRLNTINILNDYEIDKSIKGTVIKLEVNLSDEKIKISPQYEKYGIKADLTDINPNYYLNEEGKLSSKFEKGVEIKGSIELSDVILKGSVGYKNKNVRFDIDTGFKVKTGLKAEGNVKGKSFLLGKTSFRLAFGISAEMKVYLKVDFEGNISVSASITDTCNIKKEYNSGINTNSKSEFDNSTKIEASMEAKFGPDFVIKAFGVAPLVDIYGYIGLKSQAKWDVNDPLKITVESYAPVIEAGVGEDSDTVLSALGVKAKIKVMDTEKAMFKSPLISTITFDLFDGRAYIGEESTTGEQIAENTGTENITSETPTEGNDVIAPENTTNANKQTEDNEGTSDNGQNNNGNNVTIVASGNRWKLDSEGTLRCFGEGDMPKSLDSSYVEWIDYSCIIKKIVIEEGITDICRLAPVDKECALEEIVIPSSVNFIYMCAFANCDKLREITIPNGVEYIQHSTFAGCTSLEKVNIPSSVKEIQDAAFRGCTKLKEITLPSGVNIGAAVFEDCISLEKVNNIENADIRSYCRIFENTLWVENRLKENPLLIINGILVDVSAESTEVIIPSSVSSVNDSLFYELTELTSITIPPQINLNSWMLRNCINLKIIYGEEGSSAERLANDMGIQFIAIQ